MSNATEQLTVWLDGPFTRAEGIEHEWLVEPLLRLLAEGRPVTAGQLAETVDRPEAQVREVLDSLPSLERDETGDIVGFGLTLRPTPHRFALEAGPTLYTYCAMDTLIFARLLERAAAVESKCPATGAPISLRVTPTGVTELQPASAVVSQALPDDASNIRESLCELGHFFADPEAAAEWTRQNPNGFVASVAEAFDLAGAFETGISTTGRRTGC